MTQAQKLEALVRVVDYRITRAAIPEFGDTFPMQDTKLVATYLVVNHRTNQLIFNHDFARALFGEQEFQGLDAVIGSEDAFTGVKRTHYWQYHLQEAVISDNPIDYMYDAVFGGNR